MKHETARVLKVTNNAGVHPLIFTVPRKSDAFQDDINPDTAAPTPAHTCQEWLGGSSKMPVTMSLSPNATNTHAVTNGVAKKPFKSVATLSKQLDEAQKRIEFLENKLKEHNIAF
jgi:coronin-1B/1C/6